MTHIIPEEALIIPLLVILIAILTPFTTVPIVFKTFNRLLKKNKTKSAITNIVGITTLFIPLWFLFMDKFQESIFTSILICLTSSILSVALIYLIREEN
jgi:fumarate reductase subunit D